MEEDESGYLFKEGHIINFEEINEKNIKYGRKTGALRVRTTNNEIDVDFIQEMKPTKEQLETIKKLMRHKWPNQKMPEEADLTRAHIQ